MGTASPAARRRPSKPRAQPTTRTTAKGARRANGTGSLSERLDTQGRWSWYGLWWAGGARVKRKIGLVRSASCPEGLTRTMAERELQRRMAADQTVAPGCRVTIEQAGAAYIGFLKSRKNRKPSTLEDYRGYMRAHIGPFFKGTIDRIDADRVELYIQAKERQGLAGKTINNQLNFLHGLFRYAIKRRWATLNPVALVDKPEVSRSDPKRIRFLTREQLEHVIRAAPPDPVGRVDAVLIRAAATTGLRQGELLALRWCDIDWIVGRIRVAESYTRGRFGSPKSGKDRSVPMGDVLAAEVERHFQRTHWKQDKDLVFAHPDTGHPLDPSKLRKRFYAALERAGVPRIKFHELRHTFGTQMAAVGTPMSSLQELMGHEHQSTTEIYKHYAPDPIGERKLVDRAFGPLSPDPDLAVSDPVAPRAPLSGDPALQIGP